MSSRCLRIVVIWNRWFCGFVVKCRVCRRLVVLWNVAGDWVGFGLLSGVGWTCRSWIAKAAYFVFQLVRWLATA